MSNPNPFLRLLLILGLILGCGAPTPSGIGDPNGAGRLLEVRDGVAYYGRDDADNPGLVPLDRGSDGATIGQAQEPLVFAPTGNRQPGFTPGAEESCITTGGASQNCVVPPMHSDGHKSFIYYINGGMGPRISGGGVARFDVYSQLNAMYVDLVAQGAETTGSGALVYGETDDINDPDLTFVIDVTEPGDSDFCSGTGTLKSNVCITGSTTGMSHDSSLVGVYHRMINVPVIHIDYEHLRNFVGWTTTNKLNAAHQAIVGAFYKGIGQGPRTNSFSTRCDQAVVTSGFACTMPPNAACKLNGWGDFGNTSSVALLGSDCGA